MPAILLRLFGMVWFFGALLFTASATSSYLFSGERQPDRSLRWQSRLRMALLWPIAIFSAAGRARLRKG
ncbi:MAG: hypothetical protein WDO72_11165 [Pseudomonadota bacterium]